MNSQNYHIQTIKKIVGLENALSKIDFITWNHDIKTLFRLKWFERGIETSSPESSPVSYKWKWAGGHDGRRAEGHKGFFLIGALGQQCFASTKKVHGMAG